MSATDAARDAAPAPDLTWMRADLMRGMPHFISPPWTPDHRYFDAEAAAAAWQRIGMRSVHLLTRHVNGVMLYPSDLRPDKPERDFFGEQVEACARRVIKVMAYYCVGFDDWAGAAHPEWRIRDERGDIPDTSLWGYPSWMCISSPWREFALGQLDEIAARYPISGFWLDIVGLPVDPALCFCDHCARAYSRYAGPANLVNVKGSEEHWAFKMWTHRRFIADARAVLHRRHPTGAVIFNGAGATYFKRYAEPLDGSDSESSECHNPVLLGTVGRLNRNGAAPFELLSCSEMTWVHPALKPDTLVELEAFAATVHGGTYTVGITHTPQGWLSPGNIERLARINAKLEAQRDLLRDTTPVYDAGVVSPWDNRAMRRVMSQVWRLVDFLRQGHFLFNLLPGFRNLEAQRVVIVPGGLSISADDRAALERYVRAGGNLIVESPTPRRHGDGPYVLEDLLGVRYAGRSPARWHYLEPEHPALRRHGQATDPVLLASAADHVALQGAERIGRLVHEFVPHDLAHMVFLVNAPERNPDDELGITVHRYGAGRVVFVAAQLSAREPRDATNPWPATLAQNLVSLLLDDRPTVSVEAGPRLELVANRKGGRLILHLLNHAYAPTASLPAPGSSEIDASGGQPTAIHARGEIDLTGPIPVHIDAAALGLTPRRARLVPQGDELSLSREGGVLAFTIPSVGVQQTIVVE